MPDGYSATDYVPRYDDEPLKWLLADHMREDHNAPLHKIARRTGLPYERVRRRYGGRT